MASLKKQRDSSTSAQEQRERRLERRREREEPAVPQKQRSKERPGWQEDEPVTELGEQFRGKHIYNIDVKG